jgi:hypothetical protein
MADRGESITMPELVKIAEIAKRLGVDLTTVRRLIAKESDVL